MAGKFGGVVAQSSDGHQLRRVLPAHLQEFIDWTSPHLLVDAEPIE